MVMHLFNRNALPFFVALLMAVALPWSVHGAEAPSRQQAVVALDRIVAVVNNEVITQFELNDYMKAVMRQLERQGTPLPPPETLQKQLLERMITDRVQLQYAKDAGVRVDDVQLDKTIRRIADENKLTLQQFRGALERDGISFDKFREEIRSEIIVTRLKEREVDNKIIVTDVEIDNYLHTQDGQGDRKDEYNLSHILVRVSEQATSEEIQSRKAKADQALDQIKKGADFRQVAAATSDAPDALQGGALGWRTQDRLPAIFIEAVAAMQIGDISPVLRSSNGFHIVKVNDKRGKNLPAVVGQTHTRHILIKTSEIVSDNDATSRLRQLKERIENGADFGELARLNSEDASASRGGDLCRISPGDRVPEFERAMSALQPGQISDPVQSPFGWHLIQVMERRKEDVTADQQRLLARQALRARKADDAYQEWLRQLRDRAYVEYRLEER